jgi:hypothetical protein
MANVHWLGPKPIALSLPLRTNYSAISWSIFETFAARWLQNGDTHHTKPVFLWRWPLSPEQRHPGLH